MCVSRRNPVFILLLIVSLLTAVLLPAGSLAAEEYDPKHPENLKDDNLDASSVILIEESSGTVIYEKNADAITAPASTTKILTVYLGLMMGDLNSTVTATATALNLPEDSSSIPLAEGETINFLDLLYATMVKSGNDGANLIAETISGSVASFASLMNDYVATLGCVNTHFANASGLDDASHRTTAREMAMIAREAMQNEMFRSIAAATEYTLPASNIYRARTLVSKHSNLLTDAADNSYYYPYATGIKTGFTDEAGYCFVGSAEKNGVKLISVVYNCSGYSRCWSDTKKLMEYGFTQYVGTSPVALYNMNPKVISISEYALDDEKLGSLELVITRADSDADDSIITLAGRLDYLAANFNDLVNIEYVHDFSAPIEQGETMAILTYYTEDGNAVEYYLTAARSIYKRVLDVPSLSEIIESTQADPNPFPRLTGEIAVLAAIPLTLLFFLFRGLKRLLTHVKKPLRRNKTAGPIGRYYR